MKRDEATAWTTARTTWLSPERAPRKTRNATHQHRRRGATYLLGRGVLVATARLPPVQRTLREGVEGRRGRVVGRRRRVHELRLVQPHRALQVAGELLRAVVRTPVRLQGRDGRQATAAGGVGAGARPEVGAADKHKTVQRWCWKRSAGEYHNLHCTLRERFVQLNRLTQKIHGSDWKESIPQKHRFSLIQIQYFNDWRVYSWQSLSII